MLEDVKQQIEDAASKTEEADAALRILELVGEDVGAQRAQMDELKKKVELYRTAMKSAGV